ncbi:DUF2520 domain-containing protein [Sphingopyxis indica]|uniref:Rossmann-like and DUF2520 domain-containing protein n=1 Tax=Sphingopyxis indica TaxID=436663 RepID=UPI0029391958|nr:DUF2520 domain-containing protein [Sphingopyxis indica]WOF45151.1 DUF2520 domain-containing protein [Sphingopyxis indica]
MTYRQIGIVGSGRVARALGLALARFSDKPLLVWGRSDDRAREAIATIGRATAASDVAEVPERCDLIAIAVSDDALGSLVTSIAPGIGAASPFIFHVSGRSGAAILDPLREAGATTAAIHPAMTFTGDAAREVERMAGAWFAITGSSDEAVKRAGEVVDMLGGRTTQIAERHRALYHAALCHAANHLVTLLDGAFDMLDMAGADNPRELVAPLVRAALENSLAEGFSALSGPLLRGDARTVQEHLRALERECPRQLEPYQDMARATIATLRRTGVEPDTRLRALLGADAHAKGRP